MKEIYYLQRKERGKVVEIARIEDNVITIIDLHKKELKDKFEITEDVKNFINDASYNTISPKTWFQKANKAGLQIVIQPMQLDLFYANQLNLF